MLQLYQWLCCHVLITLPTWAEILFQIALIGNAGVAECEKTGVIYGCMLTFYQVRPGQLHMIRVLYLSGDNDMTDAAAPQNEDFVTIFDDTYNQPDCRAYFRMMDDLDYRNQHHATAVFRAALKEMERVRGVRGSARVIDFACSYGVVTALMRHEVSLQDIFARYREPRFDTAVPEEVIKWDREWLAGNRRPDVTAHFTGIDVAKNAVAYAVDVGLLDEGYAEDLGAAHASAGLQAALGACDMIVECGSVAYLMPDILDKMLSMAGGEKPWIVTSPIRGNERAQALEVMRDHGLEVEVLGGPFRHRRFEGEDEQARAIENARAAGHETDGVESTGHFHAQLFLARPAQEAKATAHWPIDLPGPQAR